MLYQFFTLIVVINNLSW